MALSRQGAFFGGLEALDCDGYTVVAGALDAAWLERLRSAFDDAPAQGDGTQHVELADGTPHRSSWLALHEHPVLLAAAERVLGNPFRVRDLHGRSPLPGYGQQGLHADWMPRERAEPFFVLTAIWMIDAFTRENGATRVVPGTHRLVEPVPRSVAQPGAVHPSEVVVTGEAGSVFLFNGHTWHSGRRNASAKPRRAAQMIVVRGS